MKAKSKVALRLFRKHLARLITIIAIVIVSVGFMSGLGEVQNKISISIDEEYVSYNISDLYLKSKSTFGFSKAERDKIKEEYGEENVLELLSFEEKTDDKIFRMYSYNLKDASINTLELLKGRLPETSSEIVIERATDHFIKREIGDKITFMNNEYEIVGIVFNPMMIVKVDEPSFQFEDEYLSGVYYSHANSPIIVNDLYVTVFDKTEEIDVYSKEYEESIDLEKEKVKTLLDEDKVEVLSLYENAGLYSLQSYADKVGLISIIFVVFFMLVTILVVFSTMKRLFDEERSQIACQKTLGFNASKIVARYIFFVLIGAIVGGLLALPVGIGLTRIIYSAFNIQYTMPIFPTTLNFNYYLITFAIILISATLTTVFSGHHIAGQKPVVLLQPKAPKIGKKTFLEYIPFIWKKLSFKYKSTLRNVFLFKSRFFMTVISVLGSAVLLFAGLGLLDNALATDTAQSLVLISVALVAFSAALCALVIYNITNINVSERHREIATLMVLGYQDREVTGYIFREIYIMCLISAILGVPLGILFVSFAFNLIDFGTLTDINWWTYILAPMVTMLFSYISTRLLKRKITSIDMNASLKSLE